MKKLFAIAAIAMGVAATPAFADCAADMGKINDAMKSATLDEANAAKAKELMDKASAAQAAKDETACTTATKELMAMLNMPAQ